MTTVKTPSQSRVTLSHLMGPTEANNHGNVHGGIIMKMVDEAGALSAMRHAGSSVVTVQIDSMAFRKPIHIGSLVTIVAEVTYVGRTSIETRIEVRAENPITQTGTSTNSAYAVYVALDEEGRPKEVPPLEAENSLQLQRMEQAKERQAFRKQQMRQEEESRQLKAREDGQ